MNIRVTTILLFVSTFLLTFLAIINGTKQQYGRHLDLHETSVLSAALHNGKVRLSDHYPTSTVRNTFHSSSSIQVIPPSIINVNHETSSTTQQQQQLNQQQQQQQSLQQQSLQHEQQQSLQHEQQQQQQQQQQSQQETPQIKRRIGKSLQQEQHNKPTQENNEQAEVTYSSNQNVSSVLSIPLSQYQNKTSPVEGLLKIFVYDLDPIYTDHVQKCAIPAYLSGTPPEIAKEDYRSEIVLINLFKTFPGRTYDPKEADIFVVPYAHASHCLCAVDWQNHCKHIPPQSTQNLLDSLKFYTKKTKYLHLFILAGGKDLAHEQLVSMPLMLTTGPRFNHSGSGTIIISQFNDLPEFQPSKILARSREWWTRDRNYSFAYLSSRTNGRMGGRGGRRIRKGFDRIVETWDNSTLIGGKPFYFYSLQFKQFDKHQAYKAYKNSVLCPTLPGDAPWQRRFYDVILSGCIPLVLSWDTPSFPNGKSYWVPEGVISKQMETYSVSQTYVFAKGVVPKKLAVDYSSIVYEVEGKPTQLKNMSMMKPAMEWLLSHPRQVQRRQLNMMRYALLFSMGVGADAHMYEDQFAGLIRVLKRYRDDKVKHYRQLMVQKQKNEEGREIAGKTMGGA